MKRSGVEYLNVRSDIVASVGAEAAWVYAYLCYVSKYLPKDEAGYFALDLAHIAEASQVTKRRFVYSRNKLITYGFIKHIPGANQNCKPRYKLL